jgi:hypothetical protein
MNDQERITAVEGCAFVDEVVPGVPYIMNDEYLQYVIKKVQVQMAASTQVKLWVPFTVPNRFRCTRRRSLYRGWERCVRERR